MSTFRIYVDNQVFYHPSLSQLAVTKASVTEDSESIDSLVLSAPFNHPYLDRIKPMTSTIVCKKGDRTVFEGRAIDDGSDFYNTHTWNCESCLAYLKDTIQSPYDYKGSITGLFEYFITEHNKSVEEKKRFKTGNVTVEDKNNYVHYSCSDYTTTMDAIKDKLINTHGGYLSIRYEDGAKYIDYLAEFTEVSVNTVEYGKNICDVKINRDHTKRCTALIPVGAKVTDEQGNETEDRVDITSVNDGKNYVYDEDAVNDIGWIWTTEVWDDVTQPSNLLSKAKKRLSELTEGIVSMELTIADDDMCDIHARQYVYCKSEPHGIEGRYPCTSKTTDYLDPSNNSITIGAEGIQLTHSTSKSITRLDNQLGSITGKVESITNSKMYRTELYVEGVSIFKNKGQQSVLRCRVYSWDKEITGKLSDDCFNWHRVTGNDAADADWDSNHKGMKYVNITTEDVTDNAAFYCVVEVK